MADPPDRLGNLTTAQWEELDRFLRDWQAQIQRAVAGRPTAAYTLGRDQTLKFLELLGKLNEPGDPFSGEHGPTARNAVRWLETNTQHEIGGALASYADRVKSAVLYGLRGGAHPSQVASWLYDATKKADTDWRLVARTEMARANAEGRFQTCREQGFGRVWVPPHVGSCEDCKALLENRIFTIDELQGATNYGRKRKDWVPCLPLHPRCRHTAVPYIPEVYEKTQANLQDVAEAGLDDAALAEMFDSSGQLKPEYADAVDWERFKTLDPLSWALADAVEKTGRRRRTVAKGFFDNPQADLDPLLWEDGKLKPDVRDRIVMWWKQALGDDAPSFSHLFIIGSAASYQWGTGWRHPWLGPDQTQVFPDVDVHIVVDYPKLREKRPEDAKLTDPELHTILSTKIAQAKDGAEAAPGLRLDAFIRPEQTLDEFKNDVALTGQGVWDVGLARWLQEPVRPLSGELFGSTVLEGVGGHLAQQHPDWLTDAQAAAGELESLLTAYRDQPSPAGLAAIRSALDGYYYDRTDSFRTDGYEGHGNFVWQYLENFGPLAEIKELLHAVAA